MRMTYLSPRWRLAIVVFSTLDDPPEMATGCSPAACSLIDEPSPLVSFQTLTSQSLSDEAQVTVISSLSLSRSASAGTVNGCSLKQLGSLVSKSWHGAASG